MRLNPRVVSSAAAIALTCAVTVAAYYYKSRIAEVNEVMVFCKLRFNAYSCFDKLISYVEAAKKSISVCMPGIQNPAIQGRLVKIMHERKIKVRIIIDSSGYNESHYFLLKELIDAGAEVKCNDNPLFNMQHKFCLVDDKVLMTGTLNWGNDHSSDHWNYVYITSKKELVEPIRNEFEDMWAVFTQNIGQESIKPESNTSNTETSVEDPNTKEPKCAQDQETFRENITTPEVYIT